MHGAFIAALALAGVMVCALPYYCVLTYRGKSKTTLKYKMALSSLFVLTAALSVLSVPDKKPYMIFYLVGCFVCFIGDFILGSSERMKWFVIGSCTFGAAHAFFITSFSLAAKALIPGYKWCNGIELGFYIALYALEVLIMVWRRPPFHKLFIPMFAYYAVIMLMVCKAFGLSVCLIAGAPTLVMLLIGAILFICSDYMLGLMRFNVLRRSVLTKSFCTVSYFAAQMLIALSTFFLFRL